MKSTITFGDLYDYIQEVGSTSDHLHDMVQTYADGKLALYIQIYNNKLQVNIYGEKCDYPKLNIVYSPLDYEVNLYTVIDGIAEYSFPLRIPFGNNDPYGHDCPLNLPLWMGLERRINNELNEWKNKRAN